MNRKIVISSGKGGTGKTFISTNTAKMSEELGVQTCYLDCDVEEPNGHLFLKPKIIKEEDVTVLSPVAVDENKCILCGKCANACKYNAIAVIKEKILIFKNLCHLCGACKIVCPKDAIIEKSRKIGELKYGKSGKIDFYYALLETGEGGMSPRLIKKVKENIGQGLNIIDSPPGTSCPVVESVKNADLCILVTDPTPFGINDLKLAVDMCREIGQEPVVIVNRAEYFNNDLLQYCQDESLEIIGEIPDDRKIAECYSVGDLAVDKFPEYKNIFREILNKIIKISNQDRPVKQKIKKNTFEQNNTQKIECNIQRNSGASGNIKELVVISGKGGTGKTSLVAGFCSLEKNIVMSDCDVDAADLHLILNPKIKQKGSFSGGEIAVIDKERCNLCEACYQECKFDAIEFDDDNNTYKVNKLSCEGCGVCELVCKQGAVSLIPHINGEWYISETRFGPMSHAKLGIAEENSGKLVSLVRNKKNDLAVKYNIKNAIIDGSPGTGCPVIASITGADYAVIVTEPTVSGIHDLLRILDVTKHFSINSGIIINKYDLNIDKTREIKKIVNDKQIDFLGTIPYNKKITEAQMNGLSIIEYDNESNISNSIKEIWENIKSNSFCGIKE